MEKRSDLPGKGVRRAVGYEDIIRILIGVAGALISALGYLMWRILQRIESKVEEFHTYAWQCRQSLPEKFASKREMEQCLAEVDNLWDVVNRHEHDEFGRVVRL